MWKKIKTSFDYIHAEPELKDNMREFLLRRMSVQTGRASIPRNLLVAACLVLVLLGCSGGCWTYFTSISAISIDINPSIELKINRFDKVLSVESYNDDGAHLASELNVRFMNYMDAIDQVLKDKTIIDCLAQDDVLSIVVTSEDGERQREMLANVEHCVVGYDNAYCGTSAYEDVSAAHMHGLSFGKYRAFLELQALDPNIAPEDIRGWTMREIRDRIDVLSGSVPDSGQGESEHHGQGNGYRHGKGWEAHS